jgi:hypothetical protein
MAAYQANLLWLLNYPDDSYFGSQESLQSVTWVWGPGGCGGIQGDGGSLLIGILASLPIQCRLCLVMEKRMSGMLAHLWILTLVIQCSLTCFVLHVDVKDGV